MPDLFCLYVITSPSGKQYIGVTTRKLSARISDHANDAVRSKGPARDRPLLRAYRKYGKEAMKARKLVVSKDFGYLCLLERSAIEVFGTLVPNGYNATDGGQNSFRHTDETKEKIAAVSRRTWLRTKVKRSEKSRSRMQDPEYREKCMRKLRDPGVRARQGESMKKVWTDPEYRARLSEAIKVGRAKSA